MLIFFFCSRRRIHNEILKCKYFLNKRNYKKKIVSKIKQDTLISRQRKAEKNIKETEKKVSIILMFMWICFPVTSSLSVVYLSSKKKNMILKQFMLILP